MQKEIQENKEHIQKIYTEKAQKLLKFCIVILIVNGITYLIGFFLYNSSCRELGILQITGR